MNRAILMLLSLLSSASLAVAQQVTAPELLWTDTASVQQRDSYVAFRGIINVAKDEGVEVRLTGASWYVVWINGKYFTEGPDRYVASHPEYTLDKTIFKKGQNVIAVQVHYEGVTTRLLKNINPFLYCQVVDQNNQQLRIGWKCKKLESYAPAVARISPQLAWVEWCDTRTLPANWKEQTFVDTGWKKPASVQRSISQITPVEIASVQQIAIKPKLIAAGKLSEWYGYERDNISARFFLRELDNKTVPAQGVWRRYDLGRVRLGRPKFILDLPAGAVVEFAYAEYLQHGRVAPWINLSGGDSHNMDHYISRGGEQEFFPLTPKGGRYLEVHVIAPIKDIKFIDETFLERTYHKAAAGSFVCSDTLLNKIWNTGIETYRACTEDAVIDNPTRERGQWTGDVTTVGMKIANAGFSDLRLIRRGLIQSALSARADGMVAGLCPGGDEYLSSYAMQWISGCINYYKHTGDTSLLNYLYPYAIKNIAAFEKFRTAEGVSKKAGWAFIDWGYVEDKSATDMALNIHYTLALKDLLEWCGVINKQGDKEKYYFIYNEMIAVIRRFLETNKVSGTYNFNNIGYHKTVLAAALGLFNNMEMKQAVAYLKKHILNCFPNNPDAPRLSDPGSNNPQIITPYFAYYAFPILIENGEIDFALEQYRKCWGWALKDGRTTWLEVFDPRWSYCHQWSGSPTWQLTTYVLGLSPIFNQHKNTYQLSFVNNPLSFAKGRIPINGTNDVIDVDWKRQGDKIYYSIHSPTPVWVKTSKALTGSDEVIKIAGHHQFVFKIKK